jgi:NAD(P)-dependent dehydrogenase (short-subunit alcohol dehydrogenase family)
VERSFTGRVVLVTGAARGLGRAIAERLAELGAAVVFNTRKGGRRIKSPPSDETALVVEADVTDPKAVAAMVAQTLEKFGRIDVLVNNAALGVSTRFEKISLEEWRQVLDINLTGAFVCTQAVVPAMKARGYGRIINLSSTAGKTVSTLGGAHYTASKAGMLGLTRAAAKELGVYGITVNAICPGLIDTELTREHATSEQLADEVKKYPVARLGEAREVADLVAFLGSPAAGYITGASFDINGGDLMV